MPRASRLVLILVALAMGPAAAQPVDAPSHGDAPEATSVVGPAAVTDVGAPEAPSATAPPPPPSALRGAAFVASVVGISLINAVAVTWLGTRPQAAIVADAGRPVPLVTGLGFTASAALHFGLAHTIFPWLTGLGTGVGTTHDFTRAHEEAWKLGRWGLIPTAASLIVCFVGLGLEHAEFGRGQGVLFVGMSTLLASTLAIDVLEAVGAWLGANATRRHAP